MGKIEFDKYYTSPRTARFCIEKAYEVIGKENITEIVEPSAGCGSFSHQIENCKAYDLYPQHEYITKADFLKLDLGGYKKGRLFIGNPPFGGSTGKLIKDFYNKCVKEGDYIAFILPAGFYNNYKSFNKFEIVYQVMMEIEFTNVIVKTAFIIYKRDPNKELFKDDDEIKAIKYTRYSRTNKNDHKYKANQKHDYSFTSFGNIFKEVEPYEKAGVISVNIDEKWRSEVISFLKWIYYYNKETNIMRQFCVSTGNVDISKLNQLIKIAIPDIK